MKMLKKLALISAVSMISAGAFAMEAMDDESMAATTGQDGITVKIKPPVSNFDALTGTSYFAGTGGFAGVLSIDNIYVHDNDGMTGGATAGAITLTGMKVAGSAPIQLDIDADGGAAGAAPVLNVKVTLPATFIVRTGDIGVAGSNRTAASASTVRGIVAGSNVVVLNSIDLSLGGTVMNIQLANSPQGAMIKVDGTITGGLQISNLQLNDTAGTAATATSFGTGTGSVHISKITVTDTGAANMTLASDIDISDAGLVIGMRAGSPKSDVLMEDVRLGATATAATNANLGDVEIVGLALAGTTIAVSGH